MNENYQGSNKERKISFDLLLSSFLLVLISGIIFLAVVFRYVFVSPLSWPEEVARWLLVWLTFAGTAFAYKSGGLVSVEFFAQRFFGDRIEIIKSIDRFIVWFFYLLMSWGGFLYAKRTLLSNQLTTVTKMPAVIPKSAVFVGSILVLIVVGQDIIKNIGERTLGNTKGGI